MRSRAHSGSHDQTSHYNLIGWSHMTAESAQPRKRSNVTRPFPFPRAGSGYETGLHARARELTRGHDNITSTMLSIFGRAGAILLAVVEVSHALYA